MRSHPHSAIPILLTSLALGCASTPPPPVPYAVDALDLVGARMRYEAALDSIVFQATVAGNAASTEPTPAGGLDGAPVLGYVFLTSLTPRAVGFDADDGTVALAVVSHPDFDDTPLWDEHHDASDDDDGHVYHTHWVLLVPDERAPGGLAVRQAIDEGTQRALPPTASLPMFLDSPGFAIVERGAVLDVIVPLDRVRRQIDFTASVATVYMEVDASGASPLLALHAIIDQLPGSISVEGAGHAPSSAWPQPTDDAGTFDVTAATVEHVHELDLFVFSMETAGAAATRVPTPIGATDGAPILGYVFPTTIPPAAVGFADVEGVLALAVTTHPDFDDTPYWDESLDGNYDDDGAVYHVHWVVLVADAESGAGLSVPAAPEGAVLPLTASMPMYLAAPGFHAFAVGSRLRVLVPANAMDHAHDFRFDAVAARMVVDASSGHAIVRVEEAFDVLSGDLSMPYQPTDVESLSELD